MHLLIGRRITCFRLVCCEYCRGRQVGLPYVRSRALLTQSTIDSAKQLHQYHCRCSTLPLLHCVELPTHYPDFIRPGVSFFGLFDRSGKGPCDRECSPFLPQGPRRVGKGPQRVAAARVSGCFKVRATGVQAASLPEPRHCRGEVAGTTSKTT